jgi:hypothetical protein
MASNTQTTTTGTPILGLLGIAFVVLKLCGVIAWSWWWVTLPFWGIPALIAIVFGAPLLFALVVLFFVWLADRLRWSRS